MVVWDIIHYIREHCSNDKSIDDLPPEKREAQLFERVLEQVPIGHIEGESLAGEFGEKWLDKGASLFREVSNWLQEKKVRKQVRDFPSDPETIHAHFHCFGSYTLAHTCVNYERVLREGITGILRQINTELSSSHSTNEQSYLEAMQISLGAIIRWAERYAELLEQQNSRELASICRHVPRNPARNFHEALQSIWFIHAATGISELSGASISLGRLDQYLYPFYIRDLEQGVPKSTMENLLKDLFRKLNHYGDAACAVNLGGVDKNGNDLYNPLSELIVKIAKELQYPSPLLAVRIHPDTPDSVFEAMLVPELFQIGQPTFYGEYPCQNTLKTRGVSGNEVHKWAANSCMGLLMPGQEISDMWGGVVNLLLPLELTLNNGKPFHHNFPLKLKTEPRTCFNTFDGLYKTFCLYSEEIIEYCILANNTDTERVVTDRPNPFFSTLIDDCIARGKDRAGGGAGYHTITIEGFGLINASDALTVINELVFENKKYSLSELLDAVKHNFSGFPDILNDILQIPKFGNNQQLPDSMAAKVASFFADTIIRYNKGNRYYAPSFHTLNVHVPAGKKTGASLDGRLAGEPLAKNIGPMLGRKKDGHTSMIQSINKIDQSKFYGGQALDLSFDLNMLKSKSERQKIQALFQTYFSHGGLQIQVNGIDHKILQDAIDHPEKHEDLIVRIAGYSNYFKNLGSDIQHEMVKRFAYGQ